MQDSSKPIAVFDSGIGGLSVLREAIKILPNEDYLYYADKDHVPYGIKTKEEVKGFVIAAASFLAELNIKMLVVACNTATSSAIAELRTQYSFPVIGMEPAVKPAVSNSKNKRVLVLGTQLTLKEAKFKELVDKLDNEKIVDLLPLPELVSFAEKLNFNEDEIIPALREKFNGIHTDQYGTVVLGCTHFPFYKNALQKIFSEKADIIDGNAGTVNHVKNILEKAGLINPHKQKGNIVFYHSGKKVTDKELIDRYLSLIL